MLGYRVLFTQAPDMQQMDGVVSKIYKSSAGERPEGKHAHFPPERGREDNASGDMLMIASEVQISTFEVTQQVHRIDLMTLLPIAGEVGDLNIRGFIPAPIAERNTMIDLPFAGGDGVPAKGTSATLRLMQFLDHDCQPRSPSARFNLL
jgi:hypothetical protein